MANKIQIKRGTNLTSAGTPDAGELIYKSDTNQLFVGDGLTAATGLTAIGTATSGSNNQILTDDGSGGINSEGNLTFDGSTLNVTGSSRVTGNAGLFQLVGTDHAYMEYFPDGISAGRKAYVGFGSSSNDIFIIANESSDQDLKINVNNGGTAKTAIWIDASAEARVKLPYDNQQLAIGAGQDLRLYHLNDTSNIINYTGGLTIDNNGAGSMIIKNTSNNQDMFFNVVDDNVTKTAIKIDASDGASVKLSNDNQKLTIGAGEDLYMYHDGFDTFIRTQTGGFYIDNTLQDKDIYFRVNDGGVTTTALQIDASEIGRVILPNDNQALYFGTAGDLRIQHNGTDSLIRNHAGGLKIEDYSGDGDFYLTQYADDKDIILQSDDGSGGVTPYITLDGSTKNINIDVTTRIKKDVGDGGIFYMGADSDLALYVTGDHAVFRNYTSDGDIYLSVNDGGSSINAVQIDASDAGSAIFNHDVKVNDDGKLKAGSGNDLTLYHTSDQSYISNSTGRINVQNTALDQDIRFSVNDGGVTSNILTLNAASSRVGIGTTAPSYLLHLSGTAPELAFTDTDGTATWRARAVTNNFHITETGAGDPFVIQSGAGSNAITIMSTGNVSIGGATASRDLQVNGDGIIRVLNDSGDAGIDFNASDMQLRYRSASDKLQFYSYGTSSNVMTIQKSDGNVGIGTESPSAKLDIVATGDEGIEVTGGSGYLAGYFQTDFDYVAKFESLDASAAIVIEDSNSTSNYNRIGVATNDMFFVTNNSEAMRINSVGNVGITQGSRFYLDGTALTGDTYITSPTSNAIDILAGNNKVATLTSTSFEVGPGAVDIDFIVDDSTGTEAFRVDALTGDTTVANDLTVTGALSAGSFQVTTLDVDIIRHTNDTTSMTIANDGRVTFSGGPTISSGGINVTGASTMGAISMSGGNLTNVTDINLSGILYMDSSILIDTNRRIRNSFSGVGADIDNGVHVVDFATPDTPGSAGWYTICKASSANARGGGIINLSATGGSITPQTITIDFFVDWSGNLIRCNVYGDGGNGGQFTKVRLIETASTTELQIYIATTASQSVYVSFEKDRYNPNYSLLDPWATATPTTTGDEILIKSASFYANGARTDLFTVQDNARRLLLGRDSIKSTDLSGSTTQLYINSNTTFSGTVTTGGQIAINDTNAVIYRNSNDLELLTYAGYDINLNPAGDVHIDGASLYIPVGEKVYFGAGNHTYISEDVDDRLRFFCGGAEFMRFTEDTSDTLGLYTNNTIAMTIDTSQRVGIGTTSPQSKLHTVQTLDTVSNTLANGNYGLVVAGDVAGVATDTVGIHLAAKSVSGTPTRGASILAEVQSTGNNHDLIFATSAVSAAPAERMRIDSSGNVGIGTASPVYKLDVVGTDNDAGIRVTRGNSTSQQLFIRGYQIYNSGNHLLINAADTKELRLGHVSSTAEVVLDSSGRLIVGATAAIANVAGTGHFQVLGTGGGDSTITIGRFSNDTAPPTLAFTKSRNGTIGSNTIVQDGDNLGQIVFSASDGTDMVSNSAKIEVEVDGTPGSNDTPGRIGFYTTADGANGSVEAMRIDSTQDAHFDQDVIAFSTTPSDIRLKKNFTKIQNGLDIVTQLEGHTFNWKKGGDRLSAGFKAQEVEKILPHLVDEKKLPLRADDDKEYKILRYEEMIPYLVEAIKEQQQQINELKEKLNG